MRYLMLASAAAMIVTSGVGLAQNRPDGGYQGGRGGGQGGGQDRGQGGPPAPAAAPTRPTGSFEASCRNIQVQGSNVTAECRNIHSQYPVSTINFTACRGDLSNDNGVLTCPGASASAPPRQNDGWGGSQGGQDSRQGGRQWGQGAGPSAPMSTRPTGSFEASCRNIQVQGSNVTAECRNIHSQYPVSTINFTACRGDLSNDNGVLTCPGASASAPRGQDEGSGGRGNNGNNGQFTAGAVLGALLSGGSAQPAYQPGAAYPAYGDQHYGDPRYDSRYGSQGWGYGHRPGEWVSIQDRADWLNRRIDHEVADGDMSRREARDLRRDLAGLQGLEDRYRRQGMAPWMHEDLDRRFDGLAQRVHQDGPPPRDDQNRDRYGH